MVLFSYGISFSQSSDFPILDKTNFQNEDTTTNEQVTIPLYEIDIDGIKLPISLSYDNSGIRVNDLPSSVGLKWKLNAGAMIQREVNHIPDEFKGKTNFPNHHDEQIDTINGWFHDRITMQNYLGEYYDASSTSPNVPLGHKLSSFHDGSPDLYHFSSSNGDYLDFTFKKNFDFPENPYSDFSLSPMEISKNQNYNIEVGSISGLASKELFDFRFTSDQGIEYTFEKGPINELPFIYNQAGIGGGPFSDYNYYSHGDFYVSKIKTKKYDSQIEFDYIVNNKSQSTLLANITNQSIDRYWEGVLSREMNTHEVSEIRTPKEKIVFNYVNFQYVVSSGNLYDTDTVTITKTIKLLDEILIYDFNQTLISGYTFEYESSQAANGKPFLKEIRQISNDQNSDELFREFTYYDPTYIAPTLSPRQDVFGYSNGGFSNGTFDTNGYRNLTPIDLRYSQNDFAPASDRSPLFAALEAGMLKSISTKFGGKVEYSYIMNSSGDYYYGGVLVDEIEYFDHNDILVKKEGFAYSNPNGFGIPVLAPAGSQNEDLWRELFREQIPIPGSVRYNISNIAFELADTDSNIQGIQYSANLYQKYGSFFREVTMQTENIGINQPINGGLGTIVRTYQPNYNNIGRGKLLEKVEYLNNQGEPIKSDEYQYELIGNDEVLTVEFENNHNNFGSYGCSAGEQSPNYVIDPLYGGICVFRHRYKLSPYKIASVEYVLREVISKELNPSFNTSREYKTNYTYLDEATSNPDFTKIKKRTRKKVNSAVNDEYEEYLYLSEINYQNSSLEDLLEYSNPQIQMAAWKPHTQSDILLNATTYNYLSDGKLKELYTTTTKSNGEFYTKNSYINPSFNGSGILTSNARLVESYSYRSDGQIHSKVLYEKPYNEYYLYSNDYDNNYLTAILKYKWDSSSQAIPSGAQLFYHNSFETEGIATTNNVVNTNAFSGDQVFNGSSINLGNFSEDVVLSYWAFQNNEWNYVSQEYPAGNITLTIPSSYDFIDEVRVKPLGSVLETYTYKPLIGVQSVIFHNELSNKKHFDEFSREIYITDRNNKIITETKYNAVNN